MYSSTPNHRLRSEASGPEGEVKRTHPISVWFALKAREIALGCTYRSQWSHIWCIWPLKTNGGLLGWSSHAVRLTFHLPNKGRLKSYDLRICSWFWRNYNDVISSWVVIWARTFSLLKFNCTARALTWLHFFCHFFDMKKKVIYFRFWTLLKKYVFLLTCMLIFRKKSF